MRPRSVKRSKQEREYKKVRAEYLWCNPICQAQCNDDCSWNSTEVHHRKSRSGYHLNDIKHFLAVCHTCHEYIEKHSKEAYEKGWKLLRSV